ncbi:unnamed protein product [Fusarium graminearum]|uniref:Uncharacterized protein n=1 Tax=Gibberella zeae TaxID=5518 RepID=A0A4E9EGN5_GIBZA|nr:unnamed protein product [Fusarium graminearum]
MKWWAENTAQTGTKYDKQYDEKYFTIGSDDPFADVLIHGRKEAEDSLPSESPGLNRALYNS